MEKVIPPLQFDLIVELRNICIKIPLVRALKEIPIYAKTVKYICIKKLGRKIVEPHTIQFVRTMTELMIGCAQVQKYIDPRNPLISVQIGYIPAPNVLIDLGAGINVMNR